MLIKILMPILILSMITSACSSQSLADVSAIATNTPILTSTVELAQDAETTPDQAPSETPTNSPSPSPTETATPQATNTLPPSPTTSPVRAMSDAIIIDHTSIELFEKIPDDYIKAASELSMLFRHASVGFNMTLGLDCLMDVQPRRNSCDRGIPASERVHNTKYDWSNWTFEFHQPPPEQNPGWYNKVSLFIDRIDSMASSEKYDYAGFKFGYVDAVPGSEIEDQFFNYPNSPYPTIKDMEELQARHPDITLIYWTIALGRAIGSQESDSFDQQLREYAKNHNHILMDIAAIESHTSDGQPCFDNAGGGHEAICDEYTNEVNSGHLNALGSLRMAKAMWVLMARLAGWDGISD